MSSGIHQDLSWNDVFQDIINPNNKGQVYEAVVTGARPPEGGIIVDPETAGVTLV